MPAAPVSVLQISNSLPPDSIASLVGDISLDLALHGPDATPLIRLGEFIELLAADQVQFLRKDDDRGSGSYLVSFRKIVDAMKLRILDGVVQEKFGSASKRLMRIMIEHGKIDEKQVQKMAMLSAKETREKLAPLAIHGFIELQEVPRTTDRAPARTFFLWHVPLQKCYTILLEDIYRTLANIQQRKRVERDQRSRLLEKTERSDVKGNLQLLGDADRQRLEALKRITERLECAELRLDEVVMWLRDFSREERPREEKKK